VIIRMINSKFPPGAVRVILSVPRSGRRSAGWSFGWGMRSRMNKEKRQLVYKRKKTGYT
jgi:hypothetical protein